MQELPLKSLLSKMDSLAFSIAAPIVRRLSPDEVDRLEHEIEELIH